MISNEEAMEKFKQMCLEEVEGVKRLRSLTAEEDNGDVEETDFCLDPDNSQDWFSLSLGFFKALGLKSADCHDLAIEARYTHHYWC